MDQAGSRRGTRTRGHAVVELALLSPWIFFLFAGAMDMGFYAYALIATQNAARVAAENASYRLAAAGNSDLACQYALAEMKAMSNVKNLSSCGATPLVVTARAFTDSDGAAATEVSVTYTTNQMIPIPRLTGKLSITRKVQMRVL
jgi:Flp pilus assembly protein TadG